MNAASKSVQKRRISEERVKMKKFKKLAVLLTLSLVMCIFFAGCEGAGSKIMSMLSLDIELDDPALVMVADLADKTVKTEKQKTKDGIIYSVYTDNTVCVTGYEGSSPILCIPEQIEGMTVIGLENKALFKNETITQLILPDTLKYVGNYAVMHSKNLEKVTFGRDIEYIGTSAFESAKSTPTTSNGSLKTIVWNGAPKTISEKAFYFCDKLVEINLPEGVEVIGDWAFAKNFSADKIILPSTVKEISDHAFLKCTSAKEVFIAGNVKAIGTSAFYRCSAIEKLTLSEGIEVLEKGAFEECSSLKSVKLPDSLNTLGKYAFYNCPALTDVAIGENTNEIEADAFTNDTKLTIHAKEGSPAAEYAAENDIALS